MTEYLEKICPKCGQQLRFPKGVGGIVMACPTCGKKFYSDFKIAGAASQHHKGVVTTIFELPSTLLSRVKRFLLGR